MLPSGWVASQGTNAAGAPFWVASPVSPHTAPNDAFSTAPDNILDNRLDTPEFPFGGFKNVVRFWHSYDLASGLDGAVLEFSAPSINGEAFTDVTDPSVGGQFNPGAGYNGTISAAFQSPIAGRMAWTGNSGGYVFVVLSFPPSIPPGKLRFRLASDNAGASAGWRIDTFSLFYTEGPSPTPTPPPSPTPTPTPIPCGSPNMIVDSTFEAGTPWPAWTIQTSTNFGTPLCDTAACGTGGTAPPFAGTHWAWFGGAAAVETATLGQSVSILAGGQATLSFEMRIGAISFPLTDVLNVRVDGTIVQSYPEPANAESAYSLRTINLDAFADGASHDILFEYVGPTTDPSSYAVDNVTLTNGAACPTPSPPPPPTPTPPATPSATATATVPPTATPPPTSTPTPPPTPPPSPSPTAPPSPTPAQALNISTRLRVEAGDRVAIGGFIITGTAAKRVALRGLGPSLNNSGLSDVLANPTLELRGSDGTLLLQNDNWQDDPFGGGGVELIALGLALQDPNESGMVATLEPGTYTVILAGKNQASGLGLVEIYDADTAAASQLANISTRGFVRTADNVMIGGFILGQGDASTAVAVRGIGPSLAQSGLSDVLADPILELHDANGALLIANDNWQDDPFAATQLSANGLAPQDPLESGIFTTLPPGLFTAILAGKNGGVGLGLVEVYCNVQAPTRIVTNTLDGAPGSLRQVLADANSGDTIRFDASLYGRPIILGIGLVIDKDIVISGFGPDHSSIARTDGLYLSVLEITSDHTVLIEGLTLRGGRARLSGGGIHNGGSTLTLNNCVVESNTSDGSGAGIFHAGPKLTIINCAVRQNAITGAFNPIGGGIFASGTIEIRNSTISDNHVINGTTEPGAGGGIGNYGTMTIFNSTVRGNSASRGAGIANFFGPLAITNSTISGNTAFAGVQGVGNSGGGINNNGGPLMITNSTISGNSAAGGGGIVNGGSLTITNTTISDNQADPGNGSIHNFGSLEIGNTIFKTASSGANIINNSGTVVSHGYNLSTDNGGGFLTASGDQINTDPLLGSLQNNGGPTFTHELLTGSPAINAGDLNFIPPPLSDQRGSGYSRVVGGRIDVGSFEVQRAPAPTPGPARRH